MCVVHNPFEHTPPTHSRGPASISNNATTTTHHHLMTTSSSSASTTAAAMRALLQPLQLPDGSLLSGPESSFHQLPIDASTPDRIELSEAECDIDTLKKLNKQLGMRSTLWSRPTASNSATGGGGLMAAGVGGAAAPQPLPLQLQHHGGQRLQTPHHEHQLAEHQMQQQSTGGHPSDYSIAV